MNETPTPNIDNLRHQLAVTEEELASLTMKRNALRDIVRGYETLWGLDSDEQPAETPSASPAETVNGDIPRGRDAVLAVMREKPPGTNWNQLDVARLIREKGWVDPQAKDPVASVRVTLRRMAHKRELIKVRDATYMIPPDPLPASPASYQEALRTN